jgi:hypothetical protein
VKNADDTTRHVVHILYAAATKQAQKKVNGLTANARSTVLTLLLLSTAQLITEPDQKLSAQHLGNNHSMKSPKVNSNKKI